MKRLEKPYVSLAPWPEYDDSLCKDDTVTIGVQINGKRKAEIEIAADASQEAAMQAVAENEKLERAIQGKDLKKVIYVPGRILNLILK